MAAHQTYTDFHVFSLGFFAKGKHAFTTRAIHANGLFHEDVHAFFDRVFELCPAEGRRSGKDNHVVWLQNVDGLLVGIKANELGISRHRETIRVLVAKALKAGFQSVFRDIGHGHEAGALLHTHGIAGCACAASATADERYIDRIISHGMDIGDLDA